jgi:hypothetical protein
MPGEEKNGWIGLVWVERSRPVIPGILDKGRQTNVFDLRRKEKDPHIRIPAGKKGFGQGKPGGEKIPDLKALGMH